MIPFLRGAAAVRVAVLVFALGFILLTIHWMSPSLPTSLDRVHFGSPAHDPLGANGSGSNHGGGDDVGKHPPTNHSPQDADGKVSPALEGVPNTWAGDSQNAPSPDRNGTAGPGLDQDVPTELDGVPNSFADDATPVTSGGEDATPVVSGDDDSDADAAAAAAASPSEPATNVAEGWHMLPAECGTYRTTASRTDREPMSAGKFGLSYARPDPACRTFNSSLVEATVERMKAVIGDGDLYRVFENTFPNTADTAIKWRGHAANNSAEELTFIITGDIDAMWLRDSANQLQVYRDVLESKDDDVAGVFRGAINLQARYVVLAPYCNAFQPPPESGIPTSFGGSGSTVTPEFDHFVVSTCNFELDSFGAFLQLSEDYYGATGDVAFFNDFQWVYAVQSMLETARNMTAPTYDDDGRRLEPPYKFWSQTRYMTGTLNVVGTGNPVARTGMVRSPFRPSDDTAVFEFLVPANMMFARYLNSSAAIMDRVDKAPPGLAQEMRDMATQIRDGIEKHGVVEVDDGGGRTRKMYAYEVDGFGGRNLMDDANVPSLLSAPFLGYLERDDETYRNTRDFVLSTRNPWYAKGPVLNAVGSPHIKPGAGWPMAAIMRIMTTDDDQEIEQALVELLSSTAGTGLMHESVDAFDPTEYTREWFSWANGLFGQMILDLEQRKPSILKKSFQAYPLAEVAKSKEASFIQKWD